MKKCVQIILVLLLFSGCSSLKQGWKNFTAYYNTFYNTKQFYDEGLRNNLRQVPEINPNKLIRIHHAPTNGGMQEFQYAIERASSILRNHEESRYFLPAIFIIGKSYYYRSEFFSALEKFQELAALADHSLYQEAVIWQGLTYLETANYAEGIRLLELEMDDVQQWDSDLRAEYFAVLAQLHGFQNNYESAIEYLSLSIPVMNEQEKKARAFFLVAQLYENIGYDAGARNAYREISSLRTSYELEYHSKRKEAEVLRRIGNYDLAEQIFRQLSRDDKFDRYWDELQYEIARTKQLRGNYGDALLVYQQVLNDRYQSPSAYVRAKTYYGIAEIYRDFLNDFKSAAEYFERSATQRADPLMLPPGFDADVLANSFGRYAEIKRQLTEKDSLLTLGSMSDEELKIFIEDLQQAEQQRIEQEMREFQRQRATLNVTDGDESIQDVDHTTEFGFLNIHNREKLLEASLQFQNRWGDRGLVDHWRRAEAVTVSRFDRNVGSEIEAEEAITGLLQDESEAALQAFIELSDIPFTEEEKLSFRTEIESLNYQLANVFFMTLEIPDSAKTYFQKVIESDLNQELVTMAIYSMAELSVLENDREQAEDWYFYLERYNPASKFTVRLAERLGIDQTYDSVEENDPGISELYQSLRFNAENLSPVERAENFVQLATREDSEAITAMLLFDAAGEYMMAAQEQGGRYQVDRIREWILIRERYEVKQNQLQLKKDSSVVMLAEPQLPDSDRAYWQAISDSTIGVPDFSSYFPYRGAYWDSTRSLLNRIETHYASTTIMPRVRLLSQELQPPDGIEMDPASASISEQFSGIVDPQSHNVRSTSDTDRNQRSDELKTDDFSTPESSEGIYTIVLYSFSNENLARSRGAQFEDHNFNDQIYICPRVINETEYWRISVGRFEDISTAIRRSRLLIPPYDSQNFISSIQPSCLEIH